MVSGRLPMMSLKGIISGRVEVTELPEEGGVLAASSANGVAMPRPVSGSANAFVPSFTGPPTDMDVFQSPEEVAAGGGVESTTPHRGWMLV
jgi:hypothetical protein